MSLMTISVYSMKNLAEVDFFLMPVTIAIDQNHGPTFLHLVRRKPEDKFQFGFRAAEAQGSARKQTYVTDLPPSEQGER